MRFGGRSFGCTWPNLEIVLPLAYKGPKESPGGSLHFFHHLRGGAACCHTGNGSVEGRFVRSARGRTHRQQQRERCSHQLVSQKLRGHSSHEVVLDGRILVPFIPWFARVPSPSNNAQHSRKLILEWGGLRASDCSEALASILEVCPLVQSAGSNC